MSKINIPVLPVILLIAMGIIGYLFYKNVTFEEVSYFSAASEEVRKNPHEAAARLMQQAQGFEYSIAKDRGIFADLEESPIGVLLISNINELESQREAEQLLEWIQQGGVLLTTTAGQNSFFDTTVAGWFMSQIHVVSALNNDVATINRLPDNEQRTEIVYLPDSETAKSDFTVSNKYFDYLLLDNNEVDLSGNEVILYSSAIIHRAFGEGYISVYADEDIFRNNHIDKHDHSYLLLWLTEPAKAKTLTLIHRPADKPGLFSVLWSKFSLAICIFGIALAGFLRWASSRLGPIEQELPPIKNNLIAHLTARGNFWHRQKHSPQIVSEIQRAAINKLSPQLKRDGEELNLSVSERNTIIKLASEQLKCNPKQSEAILFGKATNNAAIVNTSKALQTLLHKKQLNR